MIHAYDELYLEDAMQNLGDALDYAANDCGIELTQFMDLFLISGYADAFGKGEPRVVSGYSGIELVHQVIATSGIQAPLPDATPRVDRTPQFWCGWILAYAQWKTGKPFSGLLQIISIKEVEALYPTLHEASEDKFVDVLLYREANIKFTNLKRLRLAAGITQPELAHQSGVSLRVIQQFEQRQRNINHAHAITVYRLAKEIGCSTEDLLEL